MNLSQFQQTLATYPNAPLHIALPDGDCVPAHFHVTEIGRVHKEFIDCGGTRRESSACVVQVWVAADADHRLTAGKLSKILELAAPILRGDDLPVEIEYESGTITQYPLSNIERTPSGLLFDLVTKHTDCLAPDKCGVPGVSGAKGCC